jgi:hypothetical protein
LSFCKTTERGDENYRWCLAFLRQPTAFHAGSRYKLFTAADEKLPLSMVDVKCKPQYLVFCLHYADPFSKQWPLPVESSNSPPPPRAFTLHPVHSVLGLNAPLIPQAAFAVKYRLVLAKSANKPEFAESPVRLVDIRTVSRGKRRRNPSPLEMRLDRNHPLVQDPHDSDSAGVQSVEHDVPPMFVPSQPCAD